MKRLVLHATKSLKRDNINKLCLLESDKDMHYHLPRVFRS